MEWILVLHFLWNDGHTQIVKASSYPFSSAEDLRIRGRISKTIIDIMREHGCLAGMQETDQVTLFA